MATMFWPRDVDGGSFDHVPFSAHLMKKRAVARHIGELPKIPQYATHMAAWDLPVQVGAGVLGHTTSVALGT